MADIEIEWPWQYSFPPFFTLQPHAETRVRQIAAWKALIIEYAKAAKLSIVDIGEASNLPLFYNTAIDRKVDNDTIQLLLIELQKTGNASPVDKQKHRWEIYWHTLEEWSSIIYNYITENNLVNSVLTLFELTQGETSLNLEFYGLDTEIFIKALRVLEDQGKCELMLYDDQQGVKFF